MDKFSEIIECQGAIFIKKIMEYVSEYNVTTIKEEGFSYLRLNSSEYRLQRFMEDRVEHCIRKYLVNNVLGSALQLKGIDVFYCELPKQISNVRSFFTNYQYENLAEFEIIANIKNKKVGFRYTSISEEYVVKNKDIDEIYIIDWKVPSNVNGKNKIQTELNDGTQITTYSLHAFFNTFFDNDIYEKYIAFMEDMIVNYQDYLGISTIPKLTSYQLMKFRFEVENNIIDYIKQLKKYIEVEKK